MMMMEQTSSPSKTSSESLSQKSLCSHPADSPVPLQGTHSEFRLVAMKDLEVLAGWNCSPNLGTQCIFGFSYFLLSNIVRTFLFHGNLLLNPTGFHLYFSPICFFPPMNEELQEDFLSSSYFKREFLIHLFIFSSSSKRIFNN